MYWTLELASKLEDAPWPCSKDELIDWCIRSGAPAEVVDNLKEIEDEGEIYETEPGYFNPALLFKILKLTFPYFRCSWNQGCSTKLFSLGCSMINHPSLFSILFSKTEEMI